MTKKTEPMRTSHLHYEFVKPPKDTPDEQTILGTVLAGIRKIKRGSLDDATAATVKAGFGKISDQDPREKTRIMLRRLANDGVVSITRNGEEKKGKAAKRVKLVGKQ
jgi:hypothetical protein